MKGTAKKLVDLLLSEKAKGNKDIENYIRVKLSLKAISVNKLTEDTEDDPVIISKIKAVLTEFGVQAK